MLSGTVSPFTSIAYFVSLGTYWLHFLLLQRDSLREAEKLAVGSP